MKAGFYLITCGLFVLSGCSREPSFEDALHFSHFIP